MTFLMCEIVKWQPQNLFRMERTKQSIFKDE